MIFRSFVYSNYLGKRFYLLCIKYDDILGVCIMCINLVCEIIKNNEKSRDTENVEFNILRKFGGKKGK